MSWHQRGQRRPRGADVLPGGEWMADDDEGLPTIQKLTAAELMTTLVQTILVDASGAAAAAHMRELRVSRPLVIDDVGLTVGVIAVSDLVAPLGRPTGRRRTVRRHESCAHHVSSQHAPLTAAARAMTQRRSRSLIVVDERGNATDVITGNDLLVLYLPGEKTTVTDLMRAPVISCEPELGLPRAAELIVRHEIHRLHLVDPSRADGVPVGILSTADIVAEMAYEGSDWQHAPA